MAMTMLIWYNSIIDNNIFAFNPISSPSFKKMYYDNKTGFIEVYDNNDFIAKRIRINTKLSQDEIDIIATYIFDIWRYIDKYDMLHTT